jgi:hypothetical protein
VTTPADGWQEPTSEQVAPTGAQVRHVVWRAFWGSRLLVYVSGLFGILGLGLANPPHTPMGATAPYGYFGNFLVGPLARWDSGWYLMIAKTGYSPQPKRAAFFPLYPILIHAVGWVVRSDLIAGVLISLACFVIVLILIYRLTYQEFGHQVAEVAVLLMAFVPVSFFFSAVYTESLFLALTMGAVYCARNSRWALAGVLGAFASATRNSGVLVMAPIVLMFLYGPRESTAASTAVLSGWVQDHGWRRWAPKYRPTWDLLWVLMVPVGLLAYLGYLWITTGTPFTTFNVQSLWSRQTLGPIVGIWHGFEITWQHFQLLRHGAPVITSYTPPGAARAIQLEVAQAGTSLMLFVCFLLGVAACVGVFRRLPFAYGVYAALAFLLPLSTPIATQPFFSLPRFELVVFPFFMWAAWYLVRKQIATIAIATLATSLGLMSALFSTWHFVA